jgi:small-conductance mechanosensitive channel
LNEVLAFLETWGFAALGAALLLVAALVNRFAADKRRRIRRALFLYVFFVAFAGIDRVLAHVHQPSVHAWGEPVRLVCDLASAFVCADLFAIVAFDLVLPAIGVVTLAITSDIFILFAYLFATIGVLRSAGVALSSVVTTSAVVSGVLALGMQATLGNIVGGVALQLDGSIHLGDWIQLPDGTQGKVVAIRWRHTVIETRNWDTVVVPNANLLAQNIVIMGKRAGKRVQHRMWVYFNVDYRFAPAQVIEAVTVALTAGPIDGVAADPPPNVICYDFAKDGRDSFGYYAVRYWLTDLASDDPTSSRVRARVYSALKRADIPLARPSRTLFVSPDEPERERDKRHLEQRLRAIDGVELFHPLTPEERTFVASHLQHVPFAMSETVTRQGAVAHWLYILVRGRVEVRRHVDGGPETKVVAHLEAPSFFGEMGMMTGEPRRADIVAVTEVDCYRLDKTGLQQILQERPEVASEISRTLARRDVELAAVLEDLDEEAQKARRAHAEVTMLDRIQTFFGLERTTQV